MVALHVWFHFVQSKCLEFGVQSVFFLSLSFLVFGSCFPLLNVFKSSGDLEVVDGWTDYGKLSKDWHDNELDKSCLSTSNVCGCSIAHHRDLKVLGLFHITLVKELFEKQVSPLSRGWVISERGTDIAGVQKNTWHQLFALLSCDVRSCVDQFVNVTLFFDTKSI